VHTASEAWADAIPVLRGGIDVMASEVKSYSRPYTAWPRAISPTSGHYSGIPAVAVHAAHALERAGVDDAREAVGKIMYRAMAELEPRFLNGERGGAMANATVHAAQDLHGTKSLEAKTFAAHWREGIDRYLADAPSNEYRRELWRSFDDRIAGG
jgi:hypothetical protein